MPRDYEVLASSANDESGTVWEADGQARPILLYEDTSVRQRFANSLVIQATIVALATGLFLLAVEVLLLSPKKSIVLRSFRQLRNSNAGRAFGVGAATSLPAIWSGGFFGSATLLLFGLLILIVLTGLPRRIAIDLEGSQRRRLLSIAALVTGHVVGTLVLIWPSFVGCIEGDWDTNWVVEDGVLRAEASQALFCTPPSFALALGLVVLLVMIALSLTLYWAMRRLRTTFSGA